MYNIELLKKKLQFRLNVKALIVRRQMAYLKEVCGFQITTSCLKALTTQIKILFFFILINHDTARQ